MSQLTPDIPRTPQLITSDKLELAPLSSLKPALVLAYYLENRSFHQEFSPTTPPNYFSEGFWQQKIWKSLKDWQQDDAYRFMLRIKNKDQIIGNINLTQVFRGPFQNAILGYSMHCDFQGQGLMSEAVNCLIDFSFQKLQLHRVQAATLLDNIGSQRVLEKASFQREGTAPNYLEINGVWRDHALFARTNS